MTYLAYCLLVVLLGLLYYLIKRAHHLPLHIHRRHRALQSEAIGCSRRTLAGWNRLLTGGEILRGIVDALLALAAHRLVPRHLLRLPGCPHLTRRLLHRRRFELHQSLAETSSLKLERGLTPRLRSQRELGGVGVAEELDKAGTLGGVEGGHKSLVLSLRRPALRASLQSLELSRSLYVVGDPVLVRGSVHARTHVPSRGDSVYFYNDLAIEDGVAGEGLRRVEGALGDLVLVEVAALLNEGCFLFVI